VAGSDASATLFRFFLDPPGGIDHEFSSPISSCRLSLHFDHEGNLVDHPADSGSIVQDHGLMEPGQTEPLQRPRIFLFRPMPLFSKVTLTVSIITLRLSLL